MKLQSYLIGLAEGSGGGGLQGVRAAWGDYESNYEWKNRVFEFLIEIHEEMPFDLQISKKYFSTPVELILELRNFQFYQAKIIPKIIL